MTQLPEHDVTLADLVEWDALRQQLARVKAAEMVLRTKIFKGYFPAPVEGTNNAPLANGYVLKGKFTITREVDPGALQALKDELLKAAISADKLVTYKPSLAVAEYRKLTAEQQHLMDQCLIIKAGSPALEIVLPAKAKGANVETAA